MTKEEIFNNNVNLAYKLTQKYKDSGIEFEDLKQICLLALWKAVQTYDDNRNTAFSTYTYKIIQNDIFMHLRKNKKYFTDIHLSEEISDNSKLEDIIADKDNLIEKLENKIVVEDLINSIQNARLKENERKILELRLNNYKQQQISKIVNCSQAQVSRVLKRLRKYLKY